ncbi:antitoxin VbhA family protein [Enterocloster bolteae]|uniref:antitoxin VbhA family protein n=1 Tax=Enterocloster bolteae TaxID=208479 RepID=UPI002A83BE0F|nr:antitoxin VbhA family protein [Enterocloster bolteae]MBS5632632.1 antitoxin VbhA family protein [Clostridiales bacterium]
MSKRQAWDYAFGMIGIDGLVPSDELRQMAEKEIEGTMTLEEIQRQLDSRYRRYPDA